MPISKKVLNLLDKNEIDYEIVEHKKVYTAIDKARTLKIKEKIVGKTVVLKADKDYVLAVMSADAIIDKKKIEKILSKNKGKIIKKVDFAKEKSIKENLKQAKMGSIHPFGVLWKINIIVDENFLKNKKIILNSGDYYNSIKTTSSLFKKLMPDLIIGSFTKQKKKKRKGA